MQRKIYLASFIALLAIGMTACKKNKSETTTPADYNTELTNHSDDHSMVANNMDAFDNDVAGQIETSPLGRVENATNIMTPPCGATVTFDSTPSVRRMTIVFDGPNCTNNIYRKGTVVFSIPSTMHWRDSGAVITETIQPDGLKFTRMNDTADYIIVNGSRTVTNASGGWLENLLPNSLHHRSSITHLVNATDMMITFRDGTHRNWSAARKRVFTYEGAGGSIGVVLKISGNHTEAGISGIAEWGTNRAGHAFTTSITSPLTLKQTCNWRLTGGEIKHQGLAATVTVTYGLDVAGNVASCPAANQPYYYKAVWVAANGNTFTLIHPY